MFKRGKKSPLPTPSQKFKSRFRREDKAQSEDTFFNFLLSKILSKFKNLKKKNAK